MLSTPQMSENDKVHSKCAANVSCHYYRERKESINYTGDKDSDEQWAMCMYNQSSELLA